MSTLLDEIEDRLRTHLQPESLSLQDDSEAHRGHAGAASGGGHYHLVIVAQAFEGKSRIQRHRLVYDALQAWIPSRIHALSIDARSPSEPL